MLLADMGADVIKVEEPGAGDYLRWNPPMSDRGYSVHFPVLNRNKRSMAVDLKKEAGTELLLEMAEWAEVMVEQFRPGVMERLGLGYEAVEKVNPSIIYCSITGYGQEGPYRDVAGHDINYLGYAGVLSISGPRDGAPCVSGVQIADLAGGGMFAALSILAAYIHVLRTEEGQHLDVSMMDGSMSWLSINTGEFFKTGVPPGRQEQILHGAMPCYNIYAAADGYITVGAIEGKFWKRLCEMLGKPEYADLQFDESRFEEIFDWLSSTFKEKTRSEWMEMLSGEDVCVAPVLSLDETAVDPHVARRRMFVDVDPEEFGVSRTLGVPVKFSRTPGGIRRPPPALGEHTDEILAMLGWSGDDIARLREQRVVD